MSRRLDFALGTEPLWAAFCVLAALLARAQEVAARREDRSVSDALVEAVRAAWGLPAPVAEGGSPAHGSRSGGAG